MIFIDRKKKRFHRFCRRYRMTANDQQKGVEQKMFASCLTCLQLIIRIFIKFTFSLWLIQVDERMADGVVQGRRQQQADTTPSFVVIFVGSCIPSWLTRAKQFDLTPCHSNSIRSNIQHQLVQQLQHLLEFVVLWPRFLLTTMMASSTNNYTERIIVVL